jgi:hypothetical protein
MVKIFRVEPRGDRVLRLNFSNAAVGDFDLRPLMARATPIVAPLEEAAFFQSWFLKLGALCWPNGPRAQRGQDSGAAARARAASSAHDPDLSARLGVRRTCDPPQRGADPSGPRLVGLLDRPHSSLERIASTTDFHLSRSDAS